MKVYGLLGKTLKHSFSKGYFAEKFSNLGINDCVYENFELQNISELSQLLRNNPQIRGLNVTIPYKEEVIPFLHEQNEIVAHIKACNCIRVDEGKLYGFNTDVIGFKQSLEGCLKPHHTKALILGTGGAAKAVQYALSLLDIAYQNVSRSKKEDTITYEEVNRDVLNEYTLIVNTSPTGMYPNVNEAPVLPYTYLSKKHLLFDLIYNPEKTLFLQKGEEQGAKICNGAEMLLLQAEESWRIWNA